MQGHLAVAASGPGGALVRVDRKDSQHPVEATQAEVAVIRGRAMPGWLRVPSEALTTAKDVARWVRLGVDYARSLPPKQRSVDSARRRPTARPICARLAGG